MRPMKGQIDKDMVEAFQDIYGYLREQNLTPALHVMDNKCSKAIKTFIQKEKVNIQLVEPHNHRVNAAEPAVKAAKYHTIAGLATVNITCPLRLWCKFVPQIQDTMNMVRTSRRNSSISAYEDMEGAFDWNRTPLAPLGSKAVVIVEADERPAWGNHARDAFYVGRAPLHYRLKEFYMCDTHGFVTAVGKIYPAHCRTPTISEADLTISTAAELIETIKCTIPATVTKKLRHTKILKNILAILKNREPPRVAGSGQTRVSPA